MRLTAAAARGALLAAQGLLHPPAHPATRADVLAAIRRMGALQIDTIHVVARSPYFVLWSRLGDYEPRWLDELLAEGALFEYWGHAASFLPVEDYPLFRRMMLEFHISWWDSRQWLEENRAIAEAVMARIRAEGALRAADFDSQQRRNGGTPGWWNWKLEKVALENLFNIGELMIARRHNFQRVYDLRERVLPDWDDARTPPREEVRRELALRAVRALGAARADWVADYFRLEKRLVPPILKGLAQAGALLPLEVEGWEGPVYAHPDQLPLLEAAARDELTADATTLLSPFDPLVWDRKRALEVFGFEYSIECYLPAAKRKYGYFTLPILHRGSLAGRLEAKARRSEGVFEVSRLFLEPGFELRGVFAEELMAALQRCADWHQTPQLSLCAPA